MKDKGEKYVAHTSYFLLPTSYSQMRINLSVDSSFATLRILSPKIGEKSMSIILPLAVKPLAERSSPNGMMPTTVVRAIRVPSDPLLPLTDSMRRRSTLLALPRSSMTTTNRARSIRQA